MQLVRTLLVLTLATLFFTSCGGDTTEDSATNGADTPEATAEQTTTAQTEEATDGADDSAGEQNADQQDGDEPADDTTDETVAPERVETIDDYELRWTVLGENIRVSVSAPTTGWVAVGFDPERMMQGANIIIGYVADGTAVVTDQWGTRTIDHGLDTENGGEDNLIDFSGTESDGRTQLVFTIPLDSGDPTDKPLVVGSEYVVILAYGSRDDLESYHTHRTSARITL